MVTDPIGQLEGILAPWRRGFFKHGGSGRRLLSLRNRIQIRRPPSVGPEPLDVHYISFTLQFRQRALNRRDGEIETGGDGFLARPAFSVGVGAILEIHIDRFRAVGQLRVGVDGSKKAQRFSPPAPKLYLRLLEM